MGSNPIISRKICSVLQNLKIYKENVELIKKTFCCYKTFKNRLLKTQISFAIKFIIIELEIDCSFIIIEREQLFKERNKMFMNVFFSHKNNKCNFIDNLISRKIKTRLLSLTFFKHVSFFKKCVEGRVYGTFKGCFTVLLNGLVCLLPVKNCFYMNSIMGNFNIFTISYFDKKKVKRILLSQRNIHKQLHYTLFKMASKILFFKKKKFSNFLRKIWQT
uniref:Ribosomal protein S1 n=1 Tax=Storeatula sp. CCMP1868 TaxID=195070 RepID=A0A2P1G8C7_9CRYP|nr:ribosomal protein S1 [Storeatula sp. CCMP1868]AVM81146.1 ribosomal protein S1 [Storeatula sp. CCMP1868]